MSAIADKAVHGKPVVPHWETMFECLVEFRENEGHLDVPINYKCHDESLATWLQSQRSLQRRLSQEKIDRLVSIGVDFERGNVGSLPETVDDREGNEHDKPRTSRELRNDARWSLMVQGLVEFKEKNGHLRVKKRLQLSWTKPVHLGKHTATTLLKRAQGAYTGIVAVSHRQSVSDRFSLGKQRWRFSFPP
jgi:hypothetical protein